MQGRWGEGGCDAFAGNEECAELVRGSDDLLQVRSPHIETLANSPALSSLSPLCFFCSGLS